MEKGGASAPPCLCSRIAPVFLLLDAMLDGLVKIVGSHQV